MAWRLPKSVGLDFKKNAQNIQLMHSLGAPRASCFSSHWLRVRSPQPPSSIRNTCHWGQTYFLPNLYFGQTILGNSMCFWCTQENF